MFKHQIMLLPRDQYWNWVRAARRYVLAYGINLTPDPVTAARHFYPGQIVTIVNAPNGFPDHGDIVQWFQNSYPEAITDVIDVALFEELEAILNGRVVAGNRFGTNPPVEEALRLRWPTDYRIVEQPFGVHPEIYNHYGLPGHEGIDIRAPMGANVYACADGEVYRVHTILDGDPYGRHIRIRHRDGYRTVYAHLMQTLVAEGQRLKAGDKIGLADSTGNSNGHHLHLTLKRDGATASGMTNYPGDIIDPTPFLLFEDDRIATQPPVSYPWPSGHCLVGLNGREDGAYLDVDFEVVRQARLEAVKIEENTSIQNLSSLKTLNPAIFIMARLYYKLPQEIVEPQAWVARMLPGMERLYRAGVRYYELHRSPNLASEGWGYSWHSGGGFVRWWLETRNALKDRFADAKIGFPGVSPGGQIEGHRLDARIFLEQADEAINLADWVGVNCYWSTAQEMDEEDKGGFYKYVRRRFPSKLLFITEFSNVNELELLRAKGQQYTVYYRKLRDFPGIGAAFANVMSSRSAYGKQRWRTEDGMLTRVVEEVGRRDF